MGVPPEGDVPLRRSRPRSSSRARLRPAPQHPRVQSSRSDPRISAQPFLQRCPGGASSPHLVAPTAQSCPLTAARNSHERDPEGTWAPQRGAPHITGGAAGQGIHRLSTYLGGEPESAAISGG
ncbi:hypothetical protein NDU88_005601 [Pleurodeles waltl]|uniref:Uncharacterized protein n=1 Tax=Pleurodeles waltl TaxID=8319 RepID=A0AAV7PN55_PLEWA|nr:hypothetical protein NDU88_005601 [Pleurodeles waltl]